MKTTWDFPDGLDTCISH